MWKESLGTEISYRCVKCRGCSDCVKSKDTECFSIQEEVEQALIDKSVTVSLDKNYTSALLPFLSNPTYRLVSNDEIALKIYQNQVKNLNKNIKDKDDVIKAEKKLHDLGFVDYVENLTNEEQKKIFLANFCIFCLGGLSGILILLVLHADQFLMVLPQLIQDLVLMTCMLKEKIQ